MQLQTTARAPRADARKSRARILAAAEQVFLNEGCNVPLEQVIQVAEVGRTTFFRHFANREQLLLALLEGALDELECAAQELGDQHDALPKILVLLLDSMKRRAGMMEYWLQLGQENTVLQQAHRRMEGVYRQALANARAHGVCRADLTMAEVILFAPMLSGAALRSPSGQRAEALERAASLLFRGMGLAEDGLRFRPPSRSRPKP